LHFPYENVFGVLIRGDSTGISSSYLALENSQGSHMALFAWR